MLNIQISKEEVFDLLSCLCIKESGCGICSHLQLLSYFQNVSFCLYDVDTFTEYSTALEVPFGNVDTPFAEPYWYRPGERSPYYKEHHAKFRAKVD
tara:strand:+ start:27 stop:314 length:288 start_codon:yes stop_codon:yes gene_type:complete